MKIKKFQADTLPEAVAMMKAEFGEEAVILHTKVVKKGRFFGLFGKKCYEVLGAVDPNRQAAKNSSKKTAVNTNPPNTAADEEELVDIEERQQQCAGIISAAASPRYLPKTCSGDFEARFTAGTKAGVD
jgi:flagellar biosynthesis protein FlhF